MKNLGNYLSVSSEMKIVFRKNKEWEHKMGRGKEREREARQWKRLMILRLGTGYIEFGIIPLIH